MYKLKRVQTASTSCTHTLYKMQLAQNFTKNLTCTLLLYEPVFFVKKKGTENIFSVMHHNIHFKNYKVISLLNICYQSLSNYRLSPLYGFDSHKWHLIKDYITVICLQ